MYHCYVQGDRDGKGMGKGWERDGTGMGKGWERDGKGGTSASYYESMTKQTDTFKSTNKISW